MPLLINSRAISDRNALSSRICPSILKQCDIVTNRQYEFLTDEIKRFSIVDFGLDTNNIDIESIFNSFGEFSLQDELYVYKIVLVRTKDSVQYFRMSDNVEGLQCDPLNFRSVCNRFKKTLRVAYSKWKLFKLREAIDMFNNSTATNTHIVELASHLSYLFASDSECYSDMEVLMPLTSAIKTLTSFVSCSMFPNVDDQHVLVQLRLSVDVCTQNLISDKSTKPNDNHAHILSELEALHGVLLQCTYKTSHCRLVVEEMLSLREQCDAQANAMRRFGVSVRENTLQLCELRCSAALLPDPIDFFGIFGESLSSATALDMSNADMDEFFEQIAC